MPKGARMVALALPFTAAAEAAPLMPVKAAAKPKAVFHEHVLQKYR